MQSHNVFGNFFEWLSANMGENKGYTQIAQAADEDGQFRLYAMCLYNPRYKRRVVLNPHLDRVQALAISLCREKMKAAGATEKDMLFLPYEKVFVHFREARDQHRAMLEAEQAMLRGRDDNEMSVRLILN